jgi:hypothetical protein
MVNKRSLMFPQNPNQNWFMSIASYQEMSLVSCLNSKTYIEARRVPWRRAHFFVALHSLSESPKKTPNSLKNASKLFRRED